VDVQNSSSQQAKPSCRVLLVAPRFAGQSYWNFTAACEIFGARFPSAPLGLITVAAMLPPTWECRLVNRNTEELTEADLRWADMVMTGGMLPQRPDALAVIDLAHAHGKPVVVGGPDATSVPEAYAAADFRVLGEAEGVIEAFIARWNEGDREGVFSAEKSKIDVTKSPVPRFDLLKREQYVYLGIQFSRGCPFTCEFCDIIELYGRVPRTKSIDQVLNELDVLYRSGYRGHLDFVDDNFIGNKKAVKAFLPHLIAWQKSHGYPFLFSTEASVNLADDDALLALMREANFFTVFMGIESPDTETLVSMQKKQNTRRKLSEGVHKIYRAGMSVHAGFIVGFDSERRSVAEEMVACIEETSIPMCTVGLLYALPGTQLTRRLAAEGRLFPGSYIESVVARGGGDQSVHGLNFETVRPRADILRDYRAVLKRIYSARAYYKRVRVMLTMLDCPVQDESASKDPVRPGIAGIPFEDIALLWRLTRRIAVRQPRAFLHFCRLLYECARGNPRALPYAGMMAGLYLHLGPFSQFVISETERQIAEIESGAWMSPGRAMVEASQGVAA
jgi:radical SAM superfamily enzyme YgiQ (UPF0313 family)